MFRQMIALTAFGALTACGDGNPFTTDTGTGTGTTAPATSSVPETILNDLESISFDSATNTLTVAGLTQDRKSVV